MAIIAIANAVVWSGVIIFLLLRLMNQAQDVEAQIKRLEAKMGEGDEQAES